MFKLRPILFNSIGGMSILEMIIATSLMATSYMGYVGLTASSVKSRKSIEQKWIARMVCKSINNSIVTLTRPDMKDFIDSIKTSLNSDGDISVEADTKHLGWAKNWKDIYRFIDTININVCIMDDSSSCLDVSDFPKNYSDLARHNIEIRTDVEYNTIKNKTRVRVSEKKIRIGE